MTVEFNSSNSCTTTVANVLFLDSLNEDVFVCGTCKTVFNSIDIFFEHKRVCGEIINVVAPLPPVNTSEGQNFFELPESFLDTNTFSNLNETILDNHTFPNLNNPVLDTQIYGDVHQTLLDTQEYTNIIDPIPQPGELEEEYVVEALANEPLYLFFCDICKKGFNDRDELTSHISLHYLKQYQCMICGRCFKKKFHLHKHLTAHKVWPDGLNETTPKGSVSELSSFACPYCTLVFDTYQKFKTHLKTHKSMKRFKCIEGDCAELAETVEELMTHISNTHLSPQYTCYICNEKFHSLDTIADHQYNHYFDNDKDKYVKKILKCNMCEAIFRKKDTLNLHLQTENHNKVCEHCDKKFASDKRLRSHLRSHSANKTFHCHLCESSFHSEKYLNSHLMKHSTTEYKCPDCSTIFKRPDLLKRHMKGHQNNKLKCPYRDSLDCMREFTRKDKLKIHIESHAKREAKYQRNNEELLTT